MTTAPVPCGNNSPTTTPKDKPMNEQDITLSYHEIIHACDDDADWLVRII